MNDDQQSLPIEEVSPMAPAALAVPPHVGAGDAPVSVRVLDTPVGSMRAVASATGLRRLDWIAPTDPAAGLPDDGVHGAEDGVLDAAAVLDAAESQLDEYFGGRRRVFDLPVELVGSPFQVAVWRALVPIGFGATSTYGAQARAIGRPTAMRAVGSTNGRNPVAIIVPCHRIIGSDGSLTGYAGGIEAKRFLLRHEAEVAARDR